MNYFFLSDKNGNTYILVAQNLDNARKIALKSKIQIADLYELKNDTFKHEGFLLEDTKNE